MKVLYLPKKELDMLSGGTTEAEVVSHWDTTVNPPSFKGVELVFTKHTLPIDLAHELGHIKFGHHKKHPSTETLGELFEEEIEASRFASEKTGRRLRVKDACNACKEVLSHLTRVTKSKIDWLATRACYELFGADCSDSKLRAVKEELYYAWKHKGFR